MFDSLECRRVIELEFAVYPTSVIPLNADTLGKIVIATDACSYLVMQLLLNDPVKSYAEFNDVSSRINGNVFLELHHLLPLSKLTFLEWRGMCIVPRG